MSRNQNLKRNLINKVDWCVRHLGLLQKVFVDLQQSGTWNSQPLANVSWVDDNGSDETGITGRIMAPYKTLVGASSTNGKENLKVIVNSDTVNVDENDVPGGVGNYEIGLSLMPYENQSIHFYPEANFNITATANLAVFGGTDDLGNHIGKKVTITGKPNMTATLPDDVGLTFVAAFNSDCVTRLNLGDLIGTNKQNIQLFSGRGQVDINVDTVIRPSRYFCSYQDANGANDPVIVKDNAYFKVRVKKIISDYTGTSYGALSFLGLNQLYGTPLTFKNFLADVKYDVIEFTGATENFTTVLSVACRAEYTFTNSFFKWEFGSVESNNASIYAGLYNAGHKNLISFSSLTAEDSKVHIKMGKINSNKPIFGASNNLNDVINLTRCEVLFEGGTLSCQDLVGSFIINNWFVTYTDSTLTYKDFTFISRDGYCWELADVGGGGALVRTNSQIIFDNCTFIAKTGGEPCVHNRLDDIIFKNCKFINDGIADVITSDGVATNIILQGTNISNGGGLSANTTAIVGTLTIDTDII